MSALKGSHRTEETKRKISKSKMGQTAWNKGLTKETDERVKKISESKIKYYCSNEARNELSKIKMGNTNWLGKKHTEEYKKEMSESYRGEDNPCWRGGTTSLQKILRGCFMYRQWRSDIFTRDDFTCQECGQRGGHLEAHHIKQLSKILQLYEITNYEEALDCAELWNLNNGITLCKECHKKLHKKVKI